MKQQGIWAPISGTKPTDMTNANYKLQEEKAHSTILLCLSDEVLYEVGDEETEKGVWEKLETIYMTKSLTNKLLFKQHLFSLRMKEGSSLKEHLDALNSILMDLKNVEVKIEHEDAALVLLVSYLLRLKVLLAHLLSVKTLSLWKMVDLVCIQESFVNKLQEVVMSPNPWVYQPQVVIEVHIDLKKVKIKVEHRQVLEVPILEIFVTTAKRLVIGRMIVLN